MPESEPEKPAPDGLAATFSARVAARDVAQPPVPLSQTPEAIAGRLDDWLFDQHGLRDSRTRYAFTQMLLLLLAQPEATTTALQEAAGLGPRSGARSTLRLETLGLTTWTNRRRRRYHRLTRGGKDALLVVVLGPEAAAAAAELAASQR